ncbi:MAG: amidase [Acidobacteriota bacterium]|nr:amidase [Acidobacteriota bacterium]
MTNLFEMSASQIATAIRQRVVGPVEVVAAHIGRMEKVDRRLNAVVTPTFERARDEARRAQRMLDEHGEDDLPPLFGVPITVKDCWPVAGVRTTGGSWYLRDHIADEDAEPVRLLRRAGAIILGKTNMPDMCWSGETHNLLFGRTHNPHRRGFTAGGSSGGEGAIIAAGGSPLGLGSDAAGSVRIPSAANGCTALKPTAGRIPTGGHLPQFPPQLDGWNTAGPLARRIEDLTLALRVLSKTPVRDVGSIGLSGRSCTVSLNRLLLPVHGEVVRAVDLAAETLREAGMEVVPADDLSLKELAYIYVGLIRRYGHPALRTALGGGRPYRLWREVVRNLAGRGRISPHVLGFVCSLDLLGLASQMRGLASFERLAHYRNQTLEYLGNGGVLLCPVLTTRVPRHHWIWTVAVRPPYTTMFNAMGLPAAVVPVGSDRRGLPLAVQVVAGPGEDEVALAVAAELERAHGGWRLAN